MLPLWMVPAAAAALPSSAPMLRVPVLPALWAMTRLPAVMSPPSLSTRLPSPREPTCRVPVVVQPLPLPLMSTVPVEPASLAT